MSINQKSERQTFVEGLYQALFSFRLARWNVIYKARMLFTKRNENWALTVSSLQRLPIWNILSDASKSSFSTSLSMVIRAKFWSSYGKMLTYQHYDGRDG